MIGRRKGIFEDSLSARGSPGRASSTNGSISSSRSSSLASTNRQSLQHNDVWSNEGGDNGGSRSSSPRPGVGGGIGGGLGLGFKGSSKSTTNGTGGVNGGSVVEKGTNGDGWGLKSERKRHVKKDEDVWKLVQQKWVQRDCKVSPFLLSLFRPSYRESTLCLLIKFGGRGGNRYRL